MNFNPDYLDIDERLKFAKQLVSTIEYLPTPFSIALDAPWGAGKTRFLREPFKAAAIPKFNIVFYDAFEHEIDGDPFLSITSQIISQADELLQSKLNQTPPVIDASTEQVGRSILAQFSEKIGKVKKSAAHVYSSYKPKFKRVATAVGVKLVTGHTVDQLEEVMGLDDEQLDNINDAISEEALKQIEDYLGASREIQQIKQEFRLALADLCSAVKSKTLIIIDELDRCTPSHALKILESIKHLLLTENTVFLFSYNKNQLRNSIKHIYGETDADAYLRKFVQIEVSFPNRRKPSKPNLSEFIENIAKNLNIKINPSSMQLSRLATVSNASLRDIEIILLSGYRHIKSNEDYDDSYDSFMWFLIVLLHCDRECFMRTFINSGEINTSQDKDKFSDVIKKLDERIDSSFLSVINQLMNMPPRLDKKTPINRFSSDIHEDILVIANKVLNF